MDNIDKKGTIEVIKRIYENWANEHDYSKQMAIEYFMTLIDAHRYPFGVHSSRSYLRVMSPVFTQYTLLSKEQFPEIEDTSDFAKYNKDISKPDVFITHSFHGGEFDEPGECAFLTIRNAAYTNENVLSRDELLFSIVHNMIWNHYFTDTEYRESGMGLKPFSAIVCGLLQKKPDDMFIPKHQEGLPKLNFKQGKTAWPKEIPAYYADDKYNKELAAVKYYENVANVCIDRGVPQLAFDSFFLDEGKSVDNAFAKEIFAAMQKVLNERIEYVAECMKNLQNRKQARQSQLQKCFSCEHYKGKGCKEPERVAALIAEFGEKV